MLLRPATPEDLQELDRIRQAYRRMWATLRAPELNGAGTKRDAIDYYSRHLISVLKKINDRVPFSFSPV